MEQCTQLEEECKHLKELKANTESQVEQFSLTQESFKDNNNKVKYYTGLPTYATLVLFNILSPYVEWVTEMPFLNSNSLLWC